MKFKICKVETISSYSYPGEPKKFYYKGRWWQIEDILDRWYEGGLDPERALILYYKIEAESQFFILRYLPYFQKWQIVQLEDF